MQPPSLPSAVLQVDLGVDRNRDPEAPPEAPRVQLTRLPEWVVSAPEISIPREETNAVSTIDGRSSGGAVSAPIVEPPRFDADYLDNPAPQYPSQSRRLRQEGLASLRVYVTENGEPDTVLIYQSSGFVALDDAALEAVKRWRFVPAKAGDQTVAGWVIVPVRFSLRRN